MTTLRIGLLLPRSGPAALWRLGAEACAALAAAEAEAECGRAIELVPVDGGADPAAASRAAVILRDLHRVDAVVGMQLSHQRRAVERALSGRVPYIYTPPFEGGPCAPGTLAIGLEDAESLRPAIDWMVRRAGVRRVAFVGSDYVWPRAAAAATEAAVVAAGARMVACALAPIGGADFEVSLDRLRTARADLAVCVLIGEDAVRFHRAFAAAGLAPRIARLALGFDETLLWAAGPEASENLHAVQSFFLDAPPPAREPMLARYAAAFGARRPPVTALGLGCYDGVRLAAQLGRLAGGGPIGAPRPGFGRAQALALLGRESAAELAPATLCVAEGARFLPARDGTRRRARALDPGRRAS